MKSLECRLDDRSEFRRKVPALLAVLVAGLALGAASSQAGPIRGEIHFAGDFEATGGTGLADATGLTFDNPVRVTSTVGDFTSAPMFSEATINDFNFDSSFTAVTPLWETAIGGWSFDLTSITINVQSDTQLNLSGEGTLYGGSGYDPTPGTWSFQGGGSGDLTFVANSTAVPDGGGTALLLAWERCCSVGESTDAIKRLMLGVEHG